MTDHLVYEVKSKSDLESQLVKAGDKLVVVDFFATWCKPCSRISPILEKIAEEKKDSLVVVKVDVDKVEDLAREYGIEVMPTFVFKRKGEQLDTLVGSNEDKLKELIGKYTTV